VRLTVVGGGGFRVPLVYHALLEDRARPRVEEVVLYDVDRTRTRVIGRVLDQMADGHPDPPRVRVESQLDEALRGAHFVFSAMRVGGLRGRTVDEEVALAEGVLGQETTGAGGVAYGLRTVPVALDLASRVARVAPRAWVINFTNPAGMVTEAMGRVLGDRVIGICDSPIAMGARVARALGADPDQAWLDYVGLNHLGWLRRVLVEGVDRLPDLLADDVALSSFEEGRLFGGEWLRALGAVPNEYLYYYYCNREAVAAIQARPATRGAFLLRQQQEFYDRVTADPDGALSEWRRVRREREATYMAESRDDDGSDERDSSDLEAGGYEGVALALMGAIARNEGTTLILNVPNRGAVQGLDADAVVEVPCLVDTNGARPVAVGQVDAHALALMQSVKAVERLAIEAAATGSRALALRALALHPLVGSVATAERLLAGYLRQSPELASALPR